MRALGNGSLSAVVVGTALAGIVGGVALAREVSAISGRTNALETAAAHSLAGTEKLRESVEDLRAAVSENNGYLRRLLEEPRRP